MNLKISGEAVFAIVIVVIGGFVVYYFVSKPEKSKTSPVAPTLSPAGIAGAVDTTGRNGGIVPPQNNVPGWLTTVNQVETIAGQAATVIPQISDAISKLFN